MAQPRYIAPTDSRLSWPGALSLETTEAGHVVPWRLPHDRLSLFPSYESWGDLSYAASLATGIRLTFLSDTRSISLRQHPVENPKPLDLCCNGELLASILPDARGWFHCDTLPPGEKRLELWLPHGVRFELCELLLSPRAGLRRAPDGRLRWFTYGSSLTQAAGAATPSQTWAGIVARTNNVNLTNLGFTGHCQLEPMIARLIRDQMIDALSICAGANSYTGALTIRTFRAAIVGFVQIVRERHPHIPIALISPPFSPIRETKPNEAGWTLPLIREEVSSATLALREHGDDNLFYVSGLELLGKADAARLPDNLHPDAEGYRLIGERFNTHVAPRLFATKAPAVSAGFRDPALGIADVATSSAEHR